MENKSPLFHMLWRRDSTLPSIIYNSSTSLQRVINHLTSIASFNLKRETCNVILFRQISYSFNVAFCFSGREGKVLNQASMLPQRMSPSVPEQWSLMLNPPWDFYFLTSYIYISNRALLKPCVLAFNAKLLRLFSEGFRAVSSV